MNNKNSKSVQSTFDITVQIDKAYDDGYKHGYTQGKFDCNDLKVSGHWIDIDTDDYNYNTIKCSCCHKTFTIDAEIVCDIGFIKSDLKFCPNCGANMESED